MRVAAPLESIVAEQAATIDKLSVEREQYRKLYMDLLERCALLEKGIVVGKKAERFKGQDPQLTLQMLEMLLAQEDEERAAPEPAENDTEKVREHERKKPGRKPLPEHLPRVKIEVLPPEVQHKGLDAFKRIGEEVREVLERRPASMVVVQIVRPKFVERTALLDEFLAAGQDVALTDESGEFPRLIAAPPELPIERGLAGPGMLADTIVRRWQDHLPLYRLALIYARDGLMLARSTMCGWHEQLADLAEPLVEAMLKDAFTAPYLCTDATGVLVQAAEQCRRAHFWVLVAPERHVLYRYSHKHDNDAVDVLLAGYKGYLVADAATVYDHLYKSGDVVEVACWAHTRRYFFKALGSEPELATHALALIKRLFRIERAIQTAPRKKREKTRHEQSRPILDAFFQWCDEQAAVALDQTPISKALVYARNQRVALCRFLDDGRLPLDNNISERNLRREVLGRKNWLFLGSDEGARVNTIFVSLLASCQLHGLDPWAYLRDIFCLLHTWPASRLLELAPAFWKQTVQQQDTQQRLAANVFRTVTLAEHHANV
ncbi:MAG: IS66 family transposase [Nannocystis sp.]|nr:IS66 family transposase [Nannocystis sp.]MBA3546213.1 IS66 family transposase [Nannocystis sp.]